MTHVVGNTSQAQLPSERRGFLGYTQSPRPVPARLGVPETNPPCSRQTHTVTRWGQARRPGEAWAGGNVNVSDLLALVEQPKAKPSACSRLLFQCRRHSEESTHNGNQGQTTERGPQRGGVQLGLGLRRRKEIGELFEEKRVSEEGLCRMERRWPGVRAVWEGWRGQRWEKRGPCYRREH